MAERAGRGLVVAGLVVRYGGAEAAAVDDVSFQVADGELFMLLGPSGCGKSTVLRVIAGLTRPDRGRVLLGNAVLTDTDGNVHVAPQQRHVGLVFQSYALWPHMTVAETVAFPLEARGQGPEARRDLVRRALATVGLAGLADRGVPSLSGGQQQRVALARALVSNPPLLLLDEPLSNIDAELRRQMRSELRAIQRNVGATMLHVTHDREEAMEMGDRIAVMKDGRILEVGPPGDLYRRPRFGWTGSFLGEGIPLPFSDARREGRDVILETGIGPVVCRGPREIPARGGVLIRPEHVLWLDDAALDAQPSSNTFSGRVVGQRYLGTRTDYTIRIGTESLVASTVTPRADVGDDVRIHLPPDSCVPVEDLEG